MRNLLLVPIVVGLSALAIAALSCGGESKKELKLGSLTAADHGTKDIGAATTGLD